MALQVYDMGTTPMGKEITIIKQLLTFYPGGDKSLLVPFTIPSE